MLVLDGSNAVVYVGSALAKLAQQPYEVGLPWEEFVNIIRADSTGALWFWQQPVRVDSPSVLAVSERYRPFHMNLQFTSAVCHTKADYVALRARFKLD
jgi:hypothetical protein